MLPRKQIFTGISMLITGVLLQVIVGLRVTGMSESMVGDVTNGRPPFEEMDDLLEQVHMQMLWIFPGIILSWLLIVVGAAVVIWGVIRYFTRKGQTKGLNPPTTDD